MEIRQISQNGFGDVNNECVYCMSILNGFLYVGTRNIATGGQIYRTQDTIHWEAVTRNGLNNRDNVDIFGLATYRDYLYIGTFNYKGAEIFKSADGINFEKVLEKGGDDPTNVDFYSFIEFKGNLFAGTCNFKNITRDIQQTYLPNIGGGIFKTSDGTRWEKTFQISNKEHNFIRCFAVLRDTLYASTGRHGTPWVLVYSKDGMAFKEITFNIVGPYYNDCPVIISFNNYLYCFIGNKKNIVPFKLFRFDGVKMEDLKNDGFGNPNNVAVMAAEIINGDLWVAARNFKEGLEIWKTSDGLIWNNIIKKGLNGDKHNENCLYSLKRYRDRIIVGTSNSSSGCAIFSIAV